MALLGCDFSVSLSRNSLINCFVQADARKTAIDCIEACVNSFQHLSAVAVYLLCGVYAMAPQWVQVRACSRGWDKRAMTAFATSQLAKDKKTPHYDQVRIKSIEHSQNVRKALSNAYQVRQRESCLQLLSSQPLVQ